MVLTPYWDLQSLDLMAFLLSFASSKFYLFTLLKFQVNHLITPLYKPSTLLPPYIAFSYCFSTATTLVKFSSPSVFAPKQLNCGCRNTIHWSLPQVVFTAAVILKFSSQFTLPLGYVTSSCPQENEAIIRELPQVTTFTSTSTQVSICTRIHYLPSLLLLKDTLKKFME